MTVAGTTTVKFQKRVSGTQNALYIVRGGLYMFWTESFIYSETMLDIEKKYERIRKSKRRLSL